MVCQIFQVFDRVIIKLIKFDQIIYVVQKIKKIICQIMLTENKNSVLNR